MTNPFIDRQNNTIIDNTSLDFHYQHLDEIMDLVDALKIKLGKFTDNAYTEAVFQENLGEFLETLGDSSLTYLDPLYVMTTDALTYEDYLSDQSHEQAEGVSHVNKGLSSSRNAKFYPNAGALRKTKGETQ